MKDSWQKVYGGFPPCFVVGSQCSSLPNLASFICILLNCSLITQTKYIKDCSISKLLCICSWQYYKKLGKSHIFKNLFACARLCTSFLLMGKKCGTLVKNSCVFAHWLEQWKMGAGMFNTE